MKKLKCSDYIVSRLKGWGECNSQLLSELCLNPKTRKLIQLQWSDDLPDKCEQIMGKDSLYRKELLGVKWSYKYNGSDRPLKSRFNMKCLICDAEISPNGASFKCHLSKVHGLTIKDYTNEDRIRKTSESWWNCQVSSNSFTDYR